MNTKTFSPAKAPLFGARQLLALAYALAAVLWVVWCAVGCGVMLSHRAAGEMPTGLVAPDGLECGSFAPYSSNQWWVAPDDDPAWYLSTDADPHIFWRGQGYIETVRLHARHRLPPGAVTLYYLLPGQTDYTEAQKVFAWQSAEGEYTFDLGGKTVAGLRIDPDSAGGIPTLFYGVELNPATPWYLRFVPDAGQLLLLLAAPLVAAAFAAWLQRLWHLA